MTRSYVTVLRSCENLKNRDMPARAWPGARFWIAAKENITTKARRHKEFPAHPMRYLYVFVPLW